MSDGWTCKMSDSVGIEISEGKRMRREKQERTEWLLER